MSKKHIFDSDWMHRYKAGENYHRGLGLIGELPTAGKDLSSGIQLQRVNVSCSNCGKQIGEGSFSSAYCFCFKCGCRAEYAGEIEVKKELF